MPFSQADILSVNHSQPTNGMIYVSWTSSAPSGTYYQVYENQALIYSDTQLNFWTPIPSGPTNFAIGTVDAAERFTDFSASLPSGPEIYARLKWAGGTFESPSISSFNVYSSAIAGSAVDFTKILSTITAYPQGVVTDGFGFGEFGDGGFGESASYYKWVSGPLASGLWSFAVIPVDSAGNLGTPDTMSVSILAPPLEPAFVNGSRMSYAFTNATEIAVLNWNASPSA